MKCNCALSKLWRKYKGVEMLLEFYFRLIIYSIVVCLHCNIQCISPDSVELLVPRPFVSLLPSRREVVIGELLFWELQGCFNEWVSGNRPFLCTQSPAKVHCVVLFTEHFLLFWMRAHVNVNETFKQPSLKWAVLLIWDEYFVFPKWGAFKEVVSSPSLAQSFYFNMAV